MMLRRANWSTRFVPVLLLAFRFLSSTAVAESKPDFSGTWKSLQPSPQITIAQDGPSFVVTNAHPDGSSQTLTFRLDGNESWNTVKGAKGEFFTHVSNATWMSSAVVITTTTSRDNGGKFDWMQVYSLKSDGQLSVTTFDAVPRDARLIDTRTVLYGKVSPR